MIVFYYGGTAATMKRFDSRLASYAAQGYVVYVLNPAGAPGYGQEFSDMHIGDWGYPAGSDIIEGVTAFAEAHPFVDVTRLAFSTALRIQPLLLGLRANKDFRDSRNTLHSSNSSL